MQAARLVQILGVILLAELLVTGGLAVWKYRQPAAAVPGEQWLDPLSREELRELVERTRGNRPETWLELANALLGQGFYPHAEDAFRRVLRLKPADLELEALYGLAFCLDRTGRLAESNEVYRELAQRETGERRQECLFALGRNALRVEDEQEAERLFLENDDYFPARLLRLRLLVKTGREAEALPTIQEILRRLPNSLRFQQLRYEAHWRLGQTAQARAAADAIERAELMIPVYLSTDFLTLRSQEFGWQRYWTEYLAVEKKLDANARETILVDFTQRLQDYLSPYTLLLLKKSAEVASILGNAESLQARLQQLELLGEENPQTLQLTGDLAFLQGDRERALRLWKVSAEMSPRAEVYERLSRLAEQTDNVQESKRYKARIALLKGQNEFRENRLTEAQASLQRAVSSDPELATGWFYLGEIQRFRSNQSEARSAYLRCLELHPAHGRARLRLDWLQEASTDGGTDQCPRNFVSRLRFIAYLSSGCGGRESPGESTAVDFSSA